jgi:peptidoglycan/xylan/chitin deacetylase (PgdA/CDA1 family)
MNWRMPNKREPPLSVERIPEEQPNPFQRRLYLLYHELRPNGSRYSYVIGNAEFEEHLNLFSRLRQRTDGGIVPEISFDDGHISNFEHALPLLDARNLKAHFFITVGWTGRRPGYMGWNDLRALHAAGQNIGAHGWSHTLLTHCDEKELQTELVSARTMLEDKLGASITTMSLPGGRYNRRVLEACSKAGYTQVYTSIPRAEPAPPGSIIGRLNVRGDMKAEWIADVLRPGSQTLDKLGRQYKLKEAAKGLLGDRLYEKAWALLNRKEPNADEGEATVDEDSARHQ